MNVFTLWKWLSRRQTMRGTWGHITETASTRSGLPAWLIMFAIALAPIYLAPDLKVTALWIAPVGVVLLYVVWILFASTRDALGLANRSVLPALLKVRSEGDDVVFLLEASRLYGQGMHVAVYHEEESGFEVYVAEGRVRNIQDNGMIQVALIRWEERHSNLLERLKDNERAVATKMMVKPAATSSDNRKAGELLNHFDFDFAPLEIDEDEDQNE